MFQHIENINAPKVQELIQLIDGEQGLLAVQCRAQQYTDDSCQTRF